MTTYTIPTAVPSGLAELKRAHRRTWASGSYATVAERLVDDVPPRHLVARVSIEPGMEVLDLAAGTGNVAIRAARLGARVTALDLTPELLDHGRRRAAAAGVEVEWVEGDAEDLPFEDGRFDRVLSTFGIQFAPRHEVAAREAVRVTRPGGTIGLVNWTPQSHIGRVLKAVSGRLPKPPEYASPPPLWGDEAHVHELLAPACVELAFERSTNPFVGFGSAEEWVAFMETNYGPLLTAREKLGDDRWDEVRQELVVLTASLDQGDSGGLRVESEYLLTLGRVSATQRPRRRGHAPDHTTNDRRQTMKKREERTMHHDSRTRFMMVTALVLALAALLAGPAGARPIEEGQPALQHERSNGGWYTGLEYQDLPRLQPASGDGWYTGLEYQDLPPLQPASDDGFAWDDAAFGVGAAVTAVLLAGTLVAIRTRSRHVAAS